MRRSGKRKKKRKEDESETDEGEENCFFSNTSDSESFIPEIDPYKPFQVENYHRKYPDNSNKNEFIVFLSHIVDDRTFTDKDRMYLSQCIRKHGVSGVLHLRTINKFKVGITFDLANNANVFLQNKKLLDELRLKASIPASDTEITGVLTIV